MTKYKTIHRYNRNYKNFSFAELIPEADEEYLELTVELDSEGKVLKESKFTPDGELEEESTYNYDQNGKLTGHELYYVLDEAREKKVLLRNEKGNVISEIKYYGSDEGSRTDYEYDGKDNICSILNLDEEGEFASREIIRYDEKGAVVERAVLNAANEVISKTVYNYISPTQIEEILSNEKGELVSKTLATFDDKGNELTSVQTRPDGKLISALKNIYDDRGNVVERIYKDFYSKNVKNEYDEQNRLVKQEIFDVNGMLVKRNAFDYDEEGNILEEQNYEMDSTRGGRDKHYGTRYVYVV